MGGFAQEQTTEQRNREIAALGMRAWAINVLRCGGEVGQYIIVRPRPRPFCLPSACSLLLPP